MIARVWTVFVVECHKALYQRITWFPPLFILLAACALPGLSPIVRDGEADYHFVLFSVNILSGNLLMLFSIIYAASLAAPDLGGGLARHVFVRPVSRTEWYFGKLLFAYAYSFFLALLCAGLPWALALSFGELNGVNFGGALLHTAHVMRNAFLIGAALSIPALWAGVSFALFLSCISRSALSAAGLSLALWVVADVAKYPLGIEAWVFSTWLEGAWEPFGNMGNALPYYGGNMLRECIGSATLLIVPSVCLSLFALRRRNVTK